MILPDCVRPDSAANGPVLDAVGVYMAAASLYFVVVFLADIWNRYVLSNPWYLNKYISLNAISLTALAIATKYSTDLTTPMMKPWEQLSKLTSSILVCTVMAFVMPSLGAMNRTSSIISNVSALVIVVVTLIVDLGIQIRTKIVFLFWREQIIVMVVLFIQMLFVVSTAVIVPRTKEILEQKFQGNRDELVEHAVLFGYEEVDTYVSRTKKNLVKYWIMAHTSNPQYVAARSPTCIASSSLCLVNSGVMIVAMVRLRSALGGNICTVNYDQESGYSSQVVQLVVAIQLMGILLGTIGPTSRCMWCSVAVFKKCNFRTNFKELIKSITIDDCLKVEAYWISTLVKWKDAPLSMSFKGILIKKTIHFFKWFVLTLLVMLQMVVVMVSKLIRAVWIVPILLLHRILQNFQRSTQRTMDEHGVSIDIRYVLHLEGEENLVDFMREESWNKMTTSSTLMEKRSQMEKEKNEELVLLMKKHSTLTVGFRYFDDFVANIKSQYSESTAVDIDDSIGRARNQYSWTLVLATLSCIIKTLPGVDQEQVNLVLDGVNQGLRYVRLIEKSFDDEMLVNMRHAAEFIGIDGDYFDFDLRTFINSKDKAATEVVDELSRIPEDYLIKSKCTWKYEMPHKSIAADCMRMVCDMIFRNSYTNHSNVKLFEWLRTTSLDILGVCFTNIPKVIHMECSQSPIQSREESVRKATNLFLETKTLLESLYESTTTSTFAVRSMGPRKLESKDIVYARAVKL